VIFGSSRGSRGSRGSSGNTSAFANRNSSTLILTTLGAFAGAIPI
jgi:hypothetical protein